MTRPRDEPPPTCDYCGSDRLEWIRCKLVCRACRQIVLSCADLAHTGGPGVTTAE